MCVFCTDSAFVLTIIFFLQDHTNMEVVLHPDYVVYQDNYYTGTKLCFSQCYIQISDSTACAKQGEGTFEWAVDDLIHIDCLLFPKVSFKVLLELGTLLFPIFVFFLL